jgi:flavin-dependent dehydrogenase
MVDTEVIIVGGGPAGSSCAWELVRKGIEVRLLDKTSFPRPKLCAGWLTPQVLEDLETVPCDYPHAITSFKRLNIHIFGLRLPVPTRQYAIRRYEFDHWLIKRSAVTLHEHRVREIRREGGTYIIDDAFRCRYLVGAGGTDCPVYRTFFTGVRPRSVRSRIITMEEEFSHSVQDEKCRLWFFEHRLPGYGWYVPKQGGYINVGIGGKYPGLRKKGLNIKTHWGSFVRMLNDLSLVTGHAFAPTGCSYYIREDTGDVTNGNAFIIGDAAGLATIDMGEGIGPAVRSGILAARAIMEKTPYTVERIRRFSLPGILFSRSKVSA